MQYLYRFFICSILYLLVANSDVKAQDQQQWVNFSVDKVVSLSVPGKMDTSSVQNILTMGVLQLKQLTIVFQKIDVVDTVKLPKNLDSLQEHYKGFLKGVTKGDSNHIIYAKEAKIGKYIGIAFKQKFQKNGIDYIMEGLEFSLNNDAYGLLLMHSPDVEASTADIKKRILDSWTISPSAKQIQD